MQTKHAPQLGQRRGMVVDAQIDERECGRFAADNQQRRALLTAHVAACGLGGIQRSKQARGKVPLRVRVGFGHGRPHGGVRHHIRLHTEAFTRLVAGCGKAP